MLKPRRLAPNATIGVAALSGPVDLDSLDRGLSALRAKGYRIAEAANLRSRLGFLAGSDAARAAGYRSLLTDPSIDAIFFARGGYGASRVLALLDPDEVRAHPKIHLGSSDLTAHFAFLMREAALVAFYGPMVAVQLADEGPEALDWERVLAGSIPEIHQFAAEDILASGRAEGPLIGGCLSLLASLCGTRESIPATDSILFWEDIGEETYRLDRLLTQLERSGTLDGLRGMVIGSVLPGGRTDSPEQIGEYLRLRFRGAEFPVAMNFPAGHLRRPRTLPLGTRVRLDLDGIGKLSFLEPGVAPARGETR